ncbi:MAG: hypothetical protein ACRD10_06030 [Terriglobia bacterium]
MPEDTFLSDEFVRQLSAVGEVDVLVGIPTSNNRLTVQRVAQAVQIGLVKYFPRERTVVINPDGGSRDGTPELLMSASVQDFRSMLAANPLRTTHTLTTRYHPDLGQGAALRLILAAADLLRAKACAVVSADSATMTPEWIEALLRPIYREGYDFLAPVYQRHKFDALLVKNLLSPLIDVIYGTNFEEPAGTEFGFSGALACHFLSQGVWREDFLQYGSGIWMTTTALAGGYRPCQSFLGPKVRSIKLTEQNLAGAIKQVVGALFHSLEAHQNFWLGRTESRPAPLFGFRPELDLGPVRMNRKRLFEMFRTGVEELSAILGQLLSAPTFAQVREVAATSENPCHFPDELWAKTIYEFAVSYHRSVMNRDHLLQALTPIYRGRVCSYASENHAARIEELYQRTAALHEQFQRLRPDFVQNWSART